MNTKQVLKQMTLFSAMMTAVLAGKTAKAEPTTEINLSDRGVRSLLVTPNNIVYIADKPMNFASDPAKRMADGKAADYNVNLFTTAQDGSTANGFAAGDALVEKKEIQVPVFGPNNTILGYNTVLAQEPKGYRDNLMAKSISYSESDGKIHIIKQDGKSATIEDKPNAIAAAATYRESDTAATTTPSGNLAKLSDNLFASFEATQSGVYYLQTWTLDSKGYVAKQRKALTSFVKTKQEPTILSAKDSTLFAAAVDANGESHFLKFNITDSDITAGLVDNEITQTLSSASQFIQNGDTIFVADGSNAIRSFTSDFSKEKQLFFAPEIGKLSVLKVQDNHLFVAGKNSNKVATFDLSDTDQYQFPTKYTTVEKDSTGLEQIIIRQDKIFSMAANRLYATEYTR